MKQNQQPVLGDVFAAADSLAVQARLRLAALLATPGRTTAILPGQLASSPLPVDREARTAVRQAIEAGLGGPALTALTACRLDTVVPALRRCDADALTRRVPPQLRRPLEQQVLGAQLGRFTIGEISGWSGFGARRVGQLVGAAIEAGLDTVGPGPDRPGPAPANPTLDDLNALLAHDATLGGGLRQLLENLCSAGPPEVGTAAGRVLAALAPRPDPRLEFLDDALAAAGDQRDRGVFENGVLPLGPPMTRLELADALGISVDRVRRLAARAVRRVDAALGCAPIAVRHLASGVSERLGGAVPPAAVEEALAALGLPALPDPRSRLLLWMAGPYREVDGHRGWVAIDPAELIVETRRMIHEDDGVRLADHVAKELRSLGMAAEHVGCWLASQPVRVRDGLVIATTGAPGDIAERALHVQGRAMTVGEMAVWVPGNRAGAKALWSALDRRFVLTGSGAIALAEWGHAQDESPGRPAAGAAGRTPVNAVRARFTMSVRTPPADEPSIGHYPDGRGARVRLAPSPRPEPAAR